VKRSERIDKGLPVALKDAAVADAAAVSASTPKPGSMRLVFSTGCNAYQQWQSEVLKATAWQLKMDAAITHIVVGCDHNMEEDHKGGQDAHTSGGGDADRLVKPSEWKKSTHQKVDLFFAPAVKEAARFPWFNKPWSFYQWALNHTKPFDEEIIVILDPDEFFLSPVRHAHSMCAPARITPVLLLTVAQNRASEG
jgi:hypothetical protein